MQFVKHNPVDIETVLTVRFRRQHLIKAVGRLEDDPLLRSQDLHPLIQSGTHPDHIRGNLKNDGRLLPVSRASVNFSTLFTITAA